MKTLYEKIDLMTGQLQALVMGDDVDLTDDIIDYLNEAEESLNVVRALLNYGESKVSEELKLLVKLFR